ncbi:hypothetical protein NPIL_366751, partial [Nephila pilipes]
PSEMNHPKDACPSRHPSHVLVALRTDWDGEGTRRIGNRNIDGQFVLGLQGRIISDSHTISSPL